MAPTYPGAIAPPPGVTPNIDQGSPVTTLWFAAISIELAFPTLSMLLRLYVRPCIIGAWSIADTVFAAAWIIFVVTIGLGFTFPMFGIGDHAWNVSPERFAKFLMAIYEVAICLSKTAVLLQLEELFAPGALYERRRFILRTFIVLNALFFTAECFLRIFQCVPREKIWHPYVAGQCIDLQRAFVSTGIVNVVEDFLILFLPILWIYWLNLPGRSKVTVTLVFAAGLFVMRLVGSIQSIGQSDLTYAMVPVSLWATAEESATLTICGFPLLPRLYKHFRAKTGCNSSRPKLPTIRTQRLNTIPQDPEATSMQNLAKEDDSSLNLRAAMDHDACSRLSRTTSTGTGETMIGSVSQAFALRS